MSVAEQFSADEMHHVFSKAYNGILLSPGQILFWDFHGQTLKAIVTGIQVVELASGQRQSSGRGGSQGGRFGILMGETEINFLKAGDSAIKIKQSAKKLDLLVAH
jgi:vesicle-fusing ATPase